jgi:phage baseplate assembly protein W|tara:strand:+ start:470 stop:871 length:402 start_codon:yes stop_codon:yes gene_type:complete
VEIVASRAFKDINLSFKRHPVTNDVVAIRDEDAIKRSVKNIIFTILGEKPFEPNFGSVINDSLFDLNTNLSEIAVADEINSSLLNYEPRISNIDVTVEVAPDTNEMNCTVQYDIVGIPSPTQTVDVLLFPARV